MKEQTLYTAAGKPFSAYSNPAHDPKAALLIVHGVGEHFTRYQEMADTLGNRGYSVFGLDLFGHGTSPGIRGDAGSRQDREEQIEALTGLASESELPLILMGHSLGGLIVLHYRMTHPDAPFVAYATCSPYLALRDEMIAEENMDPDEIRRKAVFDPGAIYETKISPKMLFTKEKDRIIPRDPTMHSLIACHNLADYFDGIESVWASAGNANSPLYIFGGTEDPICCPLKMQRYAEIEHCSCDIWEGAKHEPWNEPNRFQVVSHLSDHLDQMLINAMPNELADWNKAAGQ